MLGAEQQARLPAVELAFKRRLSHSSNAPILWMGSACMASRTAGSLQNAHISLQGRPGALAKGLSRAAWQRAGPQAYRTASALLTPLRRALRTACAAMDTPPREKQVALETACAGVPPR